jgi:serine/threonine-protein kinase
MPEPDEPHDETESSHAESAAADPTAPPLIAAGRVVFDKYRLIDRIAVGTLGEVWLAEHVLLEARRALKLINPEFAQNDSGWRRFEREAQRIAKLDHPHAVAVYDVLRTRSFAYIEMEFIRGRSLDAYLKERGGQPMPLDWTVQILDQLCSVLQEAHGHVDEQTGKAQPIIHRDLKPSKLMLVDGRPDGWNLKVLDFGVGALIEDGGSQAARRIAPGYPLESLVYTSPEQLRRRSGDEVQLEIDYRSDLYSVGVILYQLLTGKLPFRGHDSTTPVAAQLFELPRPMSEANPKAKVPREVERVVM